MPFEQIWLNKLSEVHPATEIVVMDPEVLTDELDPHHWTNPRSAIGLVRAAYKPLLKMLPGSSDVLSNNFHNLIEELEILDARIQTLMDEQVARRFLVYHPAWSHFSNRYGLEQVAFEQDGKQPGARYLAELLALCRANSVQTVFVQPQSSSAHAQRFAKELGVSQKVIDPLRYDYIDNLWEISEAIAGGLW